MFRKLLCALLCACLLVPCAGALAESETSLTWDDTAWNYNADDDVYWQVGVAYCADPADLTYETLGIFVPGA